MRFVFTTACQLATYAAACLMTSGVIAQTSSPDRVITTGRASVIDGDTIEMRGERIRLFGIDAPESGQACEVLGSSYRCGQKAALALDGFIADQQVRCEQMDNDRYQRMVARCFVRGVDLSKWLVESGWALAYRRYSVDYVEAEGRAKAARRGVWAGDFVEPESFRRSERPPNTPQNPGPPPVRSPPTPIGPLPPR